jgi:hypothetical protein
MGTLDAREALIAATIRDNWGESPEPIWTPEEMAAHIAAALPTTLAEPAEPRTLREAVRLAHDTHTPCCAIPAEHVWADPIRCLKCLHNWPCPTTVAAEPAEPTAGLDAERLQVAWDAHLVHSHPALQGCYRIPCLVGIAAEYARLSQNPRGDR